MSELSAVAIELMDEAGQDALAAAVFAIDRALAAADERLATLASEARARRAAHLKRDAGTGALKLAPRAAGRTETGMLRLAPGQRPPQRKLAPPTRGRGPRRPVPAYDPYGRVDGAAIADRLIASLSDGDA